MSSFNLEVKFAAFLTTFKRIEYLEDWNKYILCQSLLPKKIIIVDNSSSKFIKRFGDKYGFEYFKNLSNEGPAGAALFGLSKLSNEGFDWIYWGDDDDPPTDPRTFERLLEIASLFPNAGIIGKVGGKFIPNRARTRLFSNSELSPITEADYVTGGKQMIVSAKLVKAGVLPNPNLFFGFEELEFCLRVKDAGFSVLVDGQGIMDARRQSGNSNPDYRWRGKSIGDSSRINRQYYSVRNMLFILWSRGHYLGYLFYLTKSLVKIPFSIRYGFEYSYKFSKLTLTAIYHHWIGRYGQYISTR